jgi:LytS/YehU family sensor histidine kinase
MAHFFFHTNHYQYFTRYSYNYYHYLVIPLYFGIYLAFVFIVYFIKKTHEDRVREKYEFMSQVRSLEMRAFRNQMDPQSTLNTFNLMASLFNTGRKDEAMNAFMKFSKLIRQNLEHSDNLTRTLKEEMETVESYIEITRLRFRDKISFNIPEIDTGLEVLKVPKMIILTHVENAVKHGLIPKSGKGQLRIVLERSVSKVTIKIEDDGIGRHKAKQLNTSGTGLGLELIQKLIDHLNKSNNDKSLQLITDIYDNDGIAGGTKIEIVLPLDLKWK